MSILKRIDADLIQALKAHDGLKATLLRGLKSDIKYKQIDKGAELTDEEILGVLSSAVKKHKESIEQFRTGNRQDLVDKETAELNHITVYLPQPLSEDEVRELIRAAIAKCGADSPAKIGLVMKEIMPQVKGRADGSVIKNFVTAILSGPDK